MPSEAQEAATPPPQRVTAEQLAQVLQEPNVKVLRKVLRLLGTDRCTILLVDALQIEAAGGSRTLDGTRRRTLGGTFFRLVKEQTTNDERYRIFPPAGSQAPTWREVRTLTQLLAAHPAGDVRMIKLSLTGRPGKVETQGSVVVFRIQGKAPASLPRGLPPLPHTPALTWTVMVALRQWNRVKDSLATNQEDVLFVEGYPVQRGSQLLVYATSCTSVALQRARKLSQQQQAEQAETPP